MLEQSEIAHYLLSLGLVKPRAVIEGDLTVVDASRRNCVFLASTFAGPTFVVKQAGSEAALTVAHEAAVLRALAKSADVAEHVPAVVHHEPEAARLVLSTPRGGRDWSDNHGRGRFPRLPARMLGRVLGALHRLPLGCVERLPSGVTPMWGLSLPEPSHERDTGSECSGAGSSGGVSRQARPCAPGLGVCGTRWTAAQSRTVTCAGRTALPSRDHARDAGRAS